MTYVVTIGTENSGITSMLIVSNNTTNAKLEALRLFWQKNPGAHVESCEARRGQGANK